MSYYEVLETLSDNKKLEETIREVEGLEKFTPPLPSREPNLKLFVKTRKTSIFNIEVKEIQGTDLQECRDIKLLDAVIQALSKMPQRLKLPEVFMNCDYGIPRYYVITAHYDADRNEVEIIDIQNVNRWTDQPGKWSYRNGYWAPNVSTEIIDTLKLHITMLQ